MTEAEVITRIEVMTGIKSMKNDVMKEKESIQRRLLEVKAGMDKEDIK